MHTARLQAEQAMHFYAGNGTTIYLSSGVCWIRPAPVWLDTPLFIKEIPLHEGEAFIVQRSGWMSVRASKRSEMVCIAPLTLPDRLQNRLRRFLNGFGCLRPSSQIRSAPLKPKN